MTFASRRTTLAAGARPRPSLPRRRSTRTRQTTLRAGDDHRQGADRRRASPAGATRRSTAAPLQATTIDAAQIRDAGARRLADLTRFDAVGDRRPTTPRATSTTSPSAASSSTTASTSAATACRSTPRPRSRSRTRRASTSSRASAASRPARARPAAWSTSSSSARSTRRCARRSSSGASAAACSARSTSASASAPTTRSACASTPAPSTSTRSCATRAGNRHVLALAGDWRVERGDAGRGRGRDTATDRSRACPASACSATACRRCPTRRSTSTTSRGRCRWCSTRRRHRCASTQKLGDDWRLVAHGLAQRLRTDDRIAFPFGCTDPKRPTAPTTPTASARRHLRPLRLPQRERARRSSTLDVALHGAAATGALAHELSVGVQRTRRADRFRDSGVQLRRHRQRSTARS